MAAALTVIMNNNNGLSACTFTRSLARGTLIFICKIITAHRAGACIPNGA